MSKRFTDTEKWGDPWFRNLLREYQIFWIYMLDNCDTAGIWKVDFELAEFMLKARIDEKEYASVFKDRIRVFSKGERWFIPKFISFQYGQLDETCHPHKSIIKVLRSFKLEGYLEGINTPNTRQYKTIQDNGKAVDNSKTPQYCHDCERYFSEQAFEKHLTACRLTAKK